VRRHHEAAGADVARVWKLPADILTTCASHHDVPIEHAVTPVRIVMGACALIRLADAQTEADGESPDLDLLRRLGVSSGVAMQLVEALKLEWSKDKPQTDD
jgi:hypothetical protein